MEYPRGCWRRGLLGARKGNTQSGASFAVGPTPNIGLVAIQNFPGRHAADHVRQRISEPAFKIACLDRGTRPDDIDVNSAGRARIAFHVEVGNIKRLVDPMNQIIEKLDKSITIPMETIGNAGHGAVDVFFPAKASDHAVQQIGRMDVRQRPWPGDDVSILLREAVKRFA